MKNIKKIILISSSAVLLAASMGNSAIVLASELSSDSSESSIHKEKDELDLMTVLEEENITEQEMNNYRMFVNNGVQQETDRGGISTRGAGSWSVKAARKAIKFAIKHYDAIPSKAVRNAVKKYGGKIVSVIDTVEAYTWYGLTSAFMKVGIPAKYADLIADFIITFVL